MYDPVPELLEHIRRLAEIWGNWSMDFHPAYAAALEAADRAERWLEERKAVEVKKWPVPDCR